MCLHFLFDYTGEIYSTVLSMYSHDIEEPLPQSDEVLLCTPESSLESVSNCSHFVSCVSILIYNILILKKIHMQTNILIPIHTHLSYEKKPS